MKLDRNKTEIAFNQQCSGCNEELCVYHV